MEEVRLDLKQIHELINDLWQVIKKYYNSAPTDANAARVVKETDEIYVKYGCSITALKAIGFTVDEIERNWRYY